MSDDINWVDALENPQSLRGLYATTDGLELVDIVEIVFSRDGPMLEVRGDLNRFADHPPPRWQPSNRVQITLSFLLTHVAMREWSTANKCHLRITRPMTDAWRFAFAGETLFLEGTCSSIRVKILTGYQSQEEMTRRLTVDDCEH